jgi:hypothetical protein
VFGYKNPSWVNRGIARISPQMGWLGRILAQLDVTKEFLAKEEPALYKKFREKTGKDISTAKDAKAWDTDCIRTTSHMTKMNYCNKQDGPAFQSLALSARCGLVWEFSRPAFGSVSEDCHDRFLGSIRGATPRKGDRRFAENVIRPYVDPRAPKVGAAAADNDDDDDDDESDTDDDVESGVGGLEDLLNGLSAMNYIHPENQARGRTAYDAANKARSASQRGLESDVEDEDDDDDDVEIGPDSVMTRIGKKLNAIIDDLDKNGSCSGPVAKTSTEQTKRLRQLSEFTEFIKVDGPNMNAETKMQQLRIHQRIYQAQKDGRLDSVNLIGYYLDRMTETRNKLIEGLEIGGEDQYVLPIALSKFPRCTCVLCDRGGKKQAQGWPWFNVHIFPAFIDGRDRFDYSEMLRDVDIKRLRYTPETVFARAQASSLLLQGRISKGDFNIFDDAVCWAYAMANFCKPLRQPGDWVEYLASRNIEMTVEKRKDGTLKYIYKKIV